MAKFSFVALLFLAIAFAVHSQKPGAGAPGIRFENVAKRAGVEFSLENHPAPEKHIIETIGLCFACPVRLAGAIGQLAVANTGTFLCLVRT